MLVSSWGGVLDTAYVKTLATGVGCTFVTMVGSVFDAGV